MSRRSAYDKKVRLMAVNKILLVHGVYTDTTFKKYIQSFEHQTETNDGSHGTNDNLEPFKEVTYSDIRQNCSPSSRRKLYFFWQIFHFFYDIWDDVVDELMWSWDRIRRQNAVYTARDKRDNYLALMLWLGATISMGIVGWITIPLYVCSRLFNLFFPLIIIIYLWHFDLWTSIDMFQYSMLIVYSGFFLVLCLLGIYVIELHHAMMFIAPGRSCASVNKKKHFRIMSGLNEYYYECASFKEQKRVLQNIFGKDIASLVISYLTRFEGKYGKDLDLLNF
jgi:hypothetical protein